jgi:hypothetical protein
MEDANLGVIVAGVGIVLLMGSITICPEKLLASVVSLVFVGFGIATYYASGG